VKVVFYGNFGCPWSSETHHAASLEELGVDVVRLQEPKVSWQNILAEAEQSDLFCWIKTHGWDTPGIDRVIAELKRREIPVVAYHLDLYMPIPGRWRQYKNDPYMRLLDHFFTVDPAMADWLNTNTSVQGHYLPAGVFEPECYLAEPTSPHGNDVIFVGSRGYHPEWPYRPQLIDWLTGTYRDRFTRAGGDAPTGTIRGHPLNQLYASSKIAVGDSFCPNFAYPHYVSDRIFEAAGRGAFQIFPRITGLDQLGWIDEENIVFYDYGNFDQLKFLIDYYLENPEEREQIRKAGHELVRGQHTYSRRWQTILETIF